MQNSVMNWKRQIQFGLVLLAALPFLAAGGCGLGGIGDELGKIREETIFELDKAINLLSQDSGLWRSTLTELEEKLTHDLQSTVRNELTELSNRAIGAAGSQIVCVMDAVPKRVLRGLQVIKARFLKQEIPLLEPTICLTSLQTIDLGAPKASRREVVYFGYDIEKTDSLKAVLIKGDGERRDITTALFRVTNYQFVVNLSPLTDDELQAYWVLLVHFGSESMSEIPIQPPIVSPPATDEEFATPSEFTFMPPHTNGDREFDGNGPNVSMRVQVANKPRYAYLKVYMKARETQSDWTEARGWSGEHRFYDAPAGWHIKEVIGQRNWNPLVSYIDDDTGDDVFSNALGQVIIVGDTDGPEAGTRTQVNIKFTYRFRIVIQEDVPGLRIFSIDDESKKLLTVK